MSEQNAKKDKPYFPLFVDLSDRDILFAGGGRIAARRIGALQPFAEHITVVSPEAEDSVQKLAEEGSITWICRSFEASDLDGRDIVFAATGDSDLNRETEPEPIARLNRNMIHNRPLNWPEACVPKTLPKAFKIYGVQADGTEVLLAHETCWHQRLAVYPVHGIFSAIRLELLECWGDEAGLFAMEAE